MNIREFNNLPEYLYHAAPECAEDSIMAKGLLTGFDGVVYLTTDPQHCLRFMGMRLMAHMHGTKVIEVEGKEMTFPNLVQHDYIPVFEIVRNELDHKAMAKSVDHDPTFYGEDVISLTYAKMIPTKAVKRALHFA